MKLSYTEISEGITVQWPQIFLPRGSNIRIDLINFSLLSMVKKHETCMKRI